MSQLKISIQYNDPETGTLCTAQRTIPYDMVHAARNPVHLVSMHATDLFESVEAARREL